MLSKHDYLGNKTNTNLIILKYADLLMYHLTFKLQAGRVTASTSISSIT